MIKIAIFTNSTNKTGLSEFVPLALYMKKNGLEPIFIFEFNSEADNTIIEKLLDNKISCYSNGKKVHELISKGNDRKSTTLKKEVFAKIKSILKSKYLFWIANKIAWVIRYKNFVNSIDIRFKKAKNIISELKPDLLLGSDDRGVNGILELLTICKKENIPFLTLQIAADDQNFLFSSLRKKNPLVQLDRNISLKLLEKRYKKHFMTFENIKVSFYASFVMYALIKRNILPSSPWYNGQSFSKKNLILNQEYYQKYLEVNQKEDHNVVVGQYSHDALFEVYKNKEQIKRVLLKKYFNIEQTEKEIIIFGMPQFYEHHIFDEKRSKEEIEYILYILSSFTDKLVLLSLHPKMPYENYNYIDEKYKNIKVLKDERLSGTLPIADYFISIFESTISWALMCEIVPVFLDYYELGFDVSKYSAVQNLKEKSTFEKDIQNIFENKTEILKDISKEKELLPPFDGKSGERILSEIRKAIDEK